MTESMHEHSFNFVSTVLKGKLENQIFEMSNLTTDQSRDLNKFLQFIENLSVEDKNFLNNQIELFEILKLKEFNSEQYNDSIEKSIDIKRINNIFKHEINDIRHLTVFQGHYISNRIRGEKKSYQHVFNKYVSVTPKSVLKVKEGDYYFHPYEYPHRLHYDNQELNATLLITTPIPINPFKQDNVIEFNDKIYNFIEQNKYLKNYKNSPILNGLMSNVLNNGLFTRSSINKKQRNYWYPALNAGLPLVPKKDELHETTFMFHDLMHHAIPDLIVTGNNSKNHKETYVIHRMMSEAFTIVLADMVFVDELVKKCIDYDWSKRKIYPVFESMAITNLTTVKLKEILWANVNFALLGDSDLMLSLCGEKQFADFKEKYEKFFIEDYRWTISNYENMMKDNDTISKWFSSNKDLISEKNTVDYFEALTKKEKKYCNKVKIVFDEIWLTIEHYINNPVTFDSTESNQKSFINYMVGQSILFFRHDYLEESKIFFELIKKELVNNKIVDIKRLRDLFNLYINKLVSENKLDENTSRIYKEVVPLFDAYYVFYDKQLKYNSIKDFLNQNMQE